MGGRAIQYKFTISGLEGQRGRIASRTHHHEDRIILKNPINSDALPGREGISHRLRHRVRVRHLPVQPAPIQRYTFVVMAQLKEVEQDVARHYDGAAFEAELSRLPRDCPVEMGVTLRWLARVTRAGDVVAEIGVGGGHYTEFLARRACHLHLVDISSRLLDAVHDKLRQAGFDGQIAGRHQVSGANLEGVPSEIVDIALLLGPLYHLQTLAERRGSVEESARILKAERSTFRRGHQSPRVLPRLAADEVRTRLPARGFPPPILARRER